mmetsp:Transcript_9044/g.19278  ORF Transcript_9044/g.19278 Transcript_9044/m.19278 type:complete len:153 (+) Transcript_9044:1511-1969(+)
MWENWTCQEDCPEKDSNDDLNDNCLLCNRKGHRMSICWLNPSNASKCPECYKPKICLDEVKKKIAEANNSKTEVQGIYIEANESSCLIIDINKEEFYDKIIITSEPLMSEFETREGENTQERMSTKMKDLGDDKPNVKLKGTANLLKAPILE